jgi:hypothetical protein
MTKSELKKRKAQEPSKLHTKSENKAPRVSTRVSKRPATTITIVTPDQQKFKNVVTVDVVAKDARRRSVMVNTVAGISAGLALFGLPVDKGVYLHTDDGQKVQVFAGSTMESKWLQYNHFTAYEK